MVMKNRFIWVAALLAVLVMLLPHSAPLFTYLFPQLERPVYTQEPFAWLLWQHILLVGVSSLFSVVVGSAIVKMAEGSVDAALALVRDLRAGLDGAAE